MPADRASSDLPATVSSFRLAAAAEVRLNWRGWAKERKERSNRAHGAPRFQSSVEDLRNLAPARRDDLVIAGKRQSDIDKFKFTLLAPAAK
jgi:hypothetical protein